MAFQSTASHPGRYGAVPRQSASGRWDVMVEIGFDPDIPATFYFSVHTYPHPSIPMPEYGFCLVVVNNLTGESCHTYDSGIVRKVLPTGAKAAVRELLEHYTMLLLASAGHPAFFMETYTPNLPAKGLKKYKRLCTIFEYLDYEVRSVPSDWPGKHKWLMSR